MMGFERECSDSISKSMDRMMLEQIAELVGVEYSSTRLDLLARRDALMAQLAFDAVLTDAARSA